MSATSTCLPNQPRKRALEHEPLPVPLRCRSGDRLPLGLVQRLSAARGCLMYLCPECGEETPDDEVDLGFGADDFICPECNGHLSDDDHQED